MRIFISSTCYDLLDLRAELEEFFRTAGILPVLSDSVSSDFRVSPDRNSIEACLANVRDCDEFLIILSGRYGPSLAPAGYEDVSATHLEYHEAVRCGKPIRMYVRDRLEADFGIWKKNPTVKDLELLWCNALHDRRLFDLLQEHRKLAKDKPQTNWMWLFRNSVELKRRLAIDFKEAIAQETLRGLVHAGRLPFLEITGNPNNFDGRYFHFDLIVQNLGEASAISPVLQLDGEANVWNLKSLSGKESTSIKAMWAVTPGIPIELPSKLTYSILEGFKFVDTGSIEILFDSRRSEKTKVGYLIKSRRYLEASPQVLVQ